MSDNVDEDPSANKILFDKGFLNGASHKVLLLDFIFFKKI